MKFIYLSFCFLMFSFPIAAKPLLERISGTWENNKKFECLSGQKPTDISDVRLKLTPLPGKTKNDGFRVLADKAVLSLNCTVKKPNPKAPLFSSSYEFEVRPLSPEVIGDEIAWRIQMFLKEVTGRIANSCYFYSTEYKLDKKSWPLKIEGNEYRSFINYALSHQNGSQGRRALNLFLCFLVWSF